MSLSKGPADDLRPSLRLGEDSAFRCARDFLDHCGYTAEAAADRIGFARLDQLAQYTLCDQAKRERNLRIQDPLNAAVKLFLCGQFVDETELSGLVPAEALAAMEALGLIEREGARWFSPVLLYPAHGLYLASDRYMNPDGSPVSTGHNFVFLVLQRNATDFIASLPGSPCDTFLDLGSGCGVAGLWAARNVANQAGSKVWSTDINPRAPHFAEFNRRLNRIDNVTIAVGDLYEPVRDLRFDRIACHPPYAMTTQPGYIYADGGEDGEVLLRRVIEGAPAHLTPGGILTSFQVATDREGDPLEQRVRGWLGEQNRGIRRSGYDRRIPGAHDVRRGDHFQRPVRAARVSALPGAVRAASRRKDRVWGGVGSPSPAPGSDAVHSAKSAIAPNHAPRDRMDARLGIRRGATRARPSSVGGAAPAVAGR